MTLHPNNPNSRKCGKKLLKNEFSSTKDVGHVRLHEKFKLIINFNSRKSHDAICTEQSEASSIAKKSIIDSHNFLVCGTPKIIR
jgi:hypothetical protein